jgi:hypothetical protein
MFRSRGVHAAMLSYLQVAELTEAPVSELMAMQARPNTRNHTYRATRAGWALMNLRHLMRGRCVGHASYKAHIDVI